VLQGGMKKKKELSFFYQRATNATFIISNNKLSYRRDSARWRSLRLSRSFNVTNCDTHQNPVCNILTYILSHTVFQLSRSICQIFAFDKPMPLVNALVLCNLFESYIAKN